MDKITLGWREWGSLPNLGIEKIKMKVDTGARTSALHTFELDTFEKDGIPFVRFSIHPLQQDASVVRVCTAPLLDERNVTDSGGHRELRPVIATELQLGNMLKKVEISLTSRETMKFRMLLGRTAMSGDCIVDPSRSFLLGRPIRSTIRNQENS